MTTTEIFSQVTDADEKAPKTTVTPAEIKAQTLYFKVRAGKMTYKSAMDKMPRTMQAASWVIRMTAEFGPAF